MDNCGSDARDNLPGRKLGLYQRESLFRCKRPGSCSELLQLLATVAQPADCAVGVQRALAGLEQVQQHRQHGLAGHFAASLVAGGVAGGNERTRWSTSSEIELRYLGLRRNM